MPSLKKLQLPPARTIVIFDLEWTSWPGFFESNWTMPGKYREIIQIGAVRLNYCQHFEEIGFFNLLVKPFKNKTLSTYIQNLTGLTQEKIDAEGVTFGDALNKFCEFCLGSDYVCWNGSDDLAIAENCKLSKISYPNLFKSGVDLQPLLSNALGTRDTWIFSGELTSKLGLPTTGDNHDALDDARGLAAAIRYLNKK